MPETHAEIHYPILESRRWSWPDEAACAACAAALARRPALADAIIELRGPLGAGKTTFVRHLLRSLGIGGRIKSPSYALLETYAPPSGHVAHFDFYRFDDAREWLDAGLRDAYVAPGLRLAEWPENAQQLLPCPDLRLRLRMSEPEGREVCAQALTPRGVELLA